MCQNSAVFASGRQRPQRRRDERQMIVLDEDGRVRRAELAVHGGGKPSVDVLVGRPVLGAKLRPHVDDVAERPEPFVGEAAVVGGEGRLLEPEPAQRVGRAVGRDPHVIRGVDDRLVRRSRAVGNPHAAALPHQAHRAQSRRRRWRRVATICAVARVRRAGTARGSTRP